MRQGTVIAIAKKPFEKNILGYRIKGTKEFGGKVVDLKHDQLVDVLKRVPDAIDNVRLQDDEIQFINGACNRYKDFNNMHSPDNVVILNKFNLAYKNNETAYEFCDVSGSSAILLESQAIEEFEKRHWGIANGKIVEQNGKKYISAIQGEYTTTILETPDVNIDKEVEIAAQASEKEAEFQRQYKLRRENQLLKDREALEKEIVEHASIRFDSCMALTCIPDKTIESIGLSLRSDRDLAKYTDIVLSALDEFQQNNPKSPNGGRIFIKADPQIENQILGELACIADKKGIEVRPFSMSTLMLNYEDSANWVNSRQFITSTNNPKYDKYEERKIVTLVGKTGRKTSTCAVVTKVKIINGSLESTDTLSTMVANKKNISDQQLKQSLAVLLFEEDILLNSAKQVKEANNVGELAKALFNTRKTFKDKSGEYK